MRRVAVLLLGCLLAMQQYGPVFADAALTWLVPAQADPCHNSENPLHDEVPVPQERNENSSESTLGWLLDHCLDKCFSCSLMPVHYLHSLVHRLDDGTWTWSAQILLYAFHQLRI